MKVIWHQEHTVPELPIHGGKDKPVDNKSLQTSILNVVPNLRAFAVSLCHSSDRADDLVQETLLKALANVGSFTPGTNMAAWLITILRNCFYSECRKQKKEAEYTNHCAASAERGVAPEQYGHLDYEDFREALMRLPTEQRESLILCVASCCSEQDAAKICGCAVGTIKSRIHRARRTLAQLMQVSSSAEFGPDEESLAVVA